MTCLFFLLLVVSTHSLRADNPFSAVAPYEGVYKQNKKGLETRLRLVAEDDVYRGKLVMGRLSFSVDAKIKSGKLVGNYMDDSGQRFPIICVLGRDNQSLTIERADEGIQLQRVGLPDNIWGYWRGEDIDLLLSQPPDRADIGGLIFFNQGKFVIRGQYKVGLLKGEFQSDGQTHEIEAEWRGDQLIFVSGVYTQELGRLDEGELGRALGALQRQIHSVERDRDLLATVRGMDDLSYQDIKALETEVAATLKRASAERDAVLLAPMFEKLGEIRKATTSLEKAIRGGVDSLAAQAYRRAQGLARTDPEAAFKSYLAAAERGHAQSQNMVGICYHNGKGIEQNRSESIRWYQKAAEQDLTVAQLNLGNAYWNGWGVTRDDAVAVAWYKKAAVGQNTKACYKLGWAYQRARGVETDFAMAFKWYEKAAGQGHVWAQYEVGVAYKSGRGVVRNYDKAHAWFSKAAAQDNGAAMNQLGLLYDDGYGVREGEMGLLDRADARRSALKYYKQAADHGHGAGARNYAYYHEYGMDVSHDFELAEKYYRLAIELKYDPAQEDLGRLLRKVAEHKELKKRHDAALGHLADLVGKEVDGKIKVNGDTIRSETKFLEVNLKSIRIKHETKTGLLSGKTKFEIQFHPGIVTNSFYIKNEGRLTLLQQGNWVDRFEVSTNGAKPREMEKLHLYGMEADFANRLRIHFKNIADYNSRY